MSEVFFAKKIIPYPEDNSKQLIEEFESKETEILKKENSKKSYPRIYLDNLTGVFGDYASYKEHLKTDLENPLIIEKKEIFNAADYNLEVSPDKLKENKMYVEVEPGNFELFTSLDTYLRFVDYWTTTKTNKSGRNKTEVKEDLIIAFEKIEKIVCIEESYAIQITTKSFQTQKNTKAAVVIIANYQKIFNVGGEGVFTPEQTITEEVQLTSLATFERMVKMFIETKREYDLDFEIEYIKQDS